MKVEMRDRLSGCESVIDPKVKRVRGITICHYSARVIRQAQHFLALRSSRLEPGCNMSARDNEDMPRIQGIPVPKCARQYTFDQDPFRGRATKRAGMGEFGH